MSAASRTRDGRRITVVEAAEPTAYCVPGREPEIVLTRGALQRLSPAELDAVVAHELAHLRGRHHLCVAWAAVPAEAFPFVPLLRVAADEVARLVEWCADDRAGRQCGNRTVARALATMAIGARAAARASGPALTAAASGVPERVRRLLSPEPRTATGRWRMAAAFALPVLAFGTAATLLISSTISDPEPLCTVAAAPHAGTR